MPVSWRQLAEIPESLTRSRILRALDVEVPSEGRSQTFDDRGIWVQVGPEGGFYVRPDGEGPRWVADGSAVLKVVRWPHGTPTGDCLRAWLRSWGWVPRSAAPEAPPPPMIL